MMLLRRRRQRAEAERAPPPADERAANATRQHRRPQGALTALVTSAFLPSGYPDTVTKDYSSYVQWNALQALSSYVRGVLASAAVFEGLGVGAASATALAAATTSAVRDITGTLGGIIFAAWQGTNFEPSAKQWRLFADVINDAALALDLASPVLASGAAGFLAVASLAALARAVVGVAAGATNAALTHHFSRGGRGSAELSAKADSRERAANVFGTVLGIAAARACAGDKQHGRSAGFVLFALLTILHVWANARAMRCLVLDTLSPARLALLLRVRGGEQQLPTPEDVAARETLLAPPFERVVDGLKAACLSCCFPPWRGPVVKMAPRVRFGAPLGELLREEGERRRRQRRGSLAAAAEDDDHDHDALLAALRRRSAQPADYLVALAPRGRRRLWGGATVLVAVRRGADADAQLRAYAHAAQLAETVRVGDQEDGAEAEAARWARREYGAWLRAAAAVGWRVGGATALLPRAEWWSEW